MWNSSGGGGGRILQGITVCLVSASTNSDYNNFGFIISAPKLNFCIRKLRRIVTNFNYLRTRVCIIGCTVIHVCRGLVQLKKINSDQG